MKIIGTTSNGFLIEATKVEVAQLQGHENNYGPYKDPCIGETLDCGKMFAALQNAKGAKNQLTEFSRELRKQADGIDAINIPLIVAIKD